jgi:hypothetical protein
MTSMADGADDGRIQYAVPVPNVSQASSVAHTLTGLPDDNYHAFGLVNDDVVIDELHAAETIAKEATSHWSPVSDGSTYTPESPVATPAGYRNPPRPWKTTLLRAAPLSGIFALAVVLVNILVSFAILAASDGVAITSWTAAPSIYLAICVAITNLAMRYACLAGVTIAWWVRAIDGSTLAKLHYDWRSGTTLRGAILAGRHLGLLGLATIFSTIVIIGNTPSPYQSLWWYGAPRNHKR